MLRVLLLLSVSLIAYAEGMDEQALSSIYTEAIWFVSVIMVMSVVSFFVSRRNARRYEEKRLREHDKEKDEVVNVSVAEEEEPLDLTDAVSVEKLLELARLHQEGLLSKEEFMAFKSKLYREIKEIHV